MPLNELELEGHFLFETFLTGILVEHSTNLLT